ncbi:hypothetical protein GQF63_06005 [Sphingobacterium humi]|uniref:WbqC family protein n=2 Tax=Sphingobacterium humi TaxID=1796905 RepID=A0A6N8KXX6_9SPHI|nr:hypothetical protein [Sphingobacterium humi]
MSVSLLLPACYLPNVSYFHAIKQHEGPILIEQFENYPKQTFRTRAQIATANGILDLIVPIVHGRKERVAIKEIKINYDHPWQRLHWLSLQTAYRSSAYFEYYEEDFRRFFTQRFDFLLDYNVQQVTLLLKLLKLPRELSLTDSYQELPATELDLRKAMSPRQAPLLQNPQPYYQLFEEKQGFLPNLSVVDLLFSQGPQAKQYF